MQHKMTPRTGLSDESIDIFLGDLDPAEAFRDPSLLTELRRKIAARALAAELDFDRYSHDGSTRSRLAQRGYRSRLHPRPPAPPEPVPPRVSRQHAT